MELADATDCDVLEQREVEDRIAGATHLGEPARLRAYVRDELLARDPIEGVGVEPAIDGRVVGHDVVDAHPRGEQEVVETERRATLCLEDAAHLPPTEQCIRHARATAEAPIAAERQLHEAARHERVLSIERTDNPLGPIVEIIQKARVVIARASDHRARPAVGDLHRESGGQPPLDARL